MAQPDAASVRPVNPVLTDLSIGFRQPDPLWNNIAPGLRRGEKSGTYFIWTRDFWVRRVENARRAPEGRYTRVGYGVSSSTYDCQEYGFEKPTGQVIVNASQTPESLPQQDVRFLTALMELEIEMQVEAAVWSANSVWDNEPDLAGATQWSETTGTPIVDSHTATRTLRRTIGVDENDIQLSVGAEVWDDLREHASLTEKYKYTQGRGGVLSEDLVAQAMGVGKLNVGRTVKNTAVEGQTAVYADVWDDRALFTPIVSAPGLMVPAPAYTFIWDEVGAFPWAVEQYFSNEIRSNVSRIFAHPDVKVTASSAGYRYDDASD